jgi:hypothetical protein
VVDEFVFLAFAEGFDGEAELVFDLVHGVVVEVGGVATRCTGWLRLVIVTE